MRLGFNSDIKSGRKDNLFSEYTFNLFEKGGQNNNFQNEGNEFGDQGIEEGDDDNNEYADRVGNMTLDMTKFHKIDRKTEFRNSGKFDKITSTLGKTRANTHSYLY